MGQMKKVDKKELCGVSPVRQRKIEMLDEQIKEQRKVQDEIRIKIKQNDIKLQHQAGNSEKMDHDYQMGNIVKLGKEIETVENRIKSVSSKIEDIEALGKSNKEIQA